MSLLPKNRQKRNQLYFALAAALVLIGGIAFGLIRPQYLKLAAIKKQALTTRDRLDTYRRLIAQSGAISNELAGASARLSRDESDMATGDVYAWTIDTMRHFKADYKVEIPEIGPPSVGQVDLLPQFPYKQLQFNLRGTGYYHDIGKFIADFENKYPHMRVVNLELSPVGGGSEKLSFSMDIIALVKSAS